MGLWSCLNFFVTKNVVPFKLLSFWLQFIRLFIFDEMNELETVEDQHLLLPSMMNSWFLIERILLKNEMIPFVKEMQFLMDDHDHLNIAIAFTTQMILNFIFFWYFNILFRVFETKNHSEASEGLSYIHKFFNLKKFPWIR